MMEEKHRQKQEEILAKETRKKEREERRIAKEADKKQKAAEREWRMQERKKAAEEKEAEKKRKAKLRAKKNADKENRSCRNRKTLPCDSSGLQHREVSDNECVVCLGVYDDDIVEGELQREWIRCKNVDTCGKWMHCERSDKQYGSYLCKVCGTCFN